MVLIVEKEREYNVFYFQINFLIYIQNWLSLFLKLDPKYSVAKCKLYQQWAFNELLNLAAMEDIGLNKERKKKVSLEERGGRERGRRESEKERKRWRERERPKRGKDM